MAISARIRKLRQERYWSWAELGKHQKQLSAYERGVILPSTEVPIKPPSAKGGNGS